jgi:hypothetical protein
MRPLDDPTSLSTDQRFSELAGILAAGLLRLAPGSSSSLPSAPQKLPESAPNCLDVSGKPSVTVHTG